MRIRRDDNTECSVWRDFQRACNTVCAQAVCRVVFSLANLHMGVIIDMAMPFMGKASPPALGELDDQGRQMLGRLGLNSAPDTIMSAVNKATRAKSIYMLAEYVFPSAHPIMLITHGKFVNGAALIVSRDNYPASGEDVMMSHLQYCILTNNRAQSVIPNADFTFAE